MSISSAFHPSLARALAPAWLRPYPCPIPLATARMPSSYGSSVKQADCKASYENGILTVSIPKITKEEKAAKQMISID